jgi:hypothetical protein
MSAAPAATEIVWGVVITASATAYTRPWSSDGVNH